MLAAGWTWAANDSPHTLESIEYTALNLYQYMPARHVPNQLTLPNPSGIGMSAGTAVVSPSTPARRGCPARRNVRSRSDWTSNLFLRQTLWNHAKCPINAGRVVLEGATYAYLEFSQESCFCVHRCHTRKLPTASHGFYSTLSEQHVGGSSVPVHIMARKHQTGVCA